MGEILTHSHQPSAAIGLKQYVDEVRPTDRLAEDDLRPVLMGLFGEVGSIMAPAKKLHREARAYAGYRAAVVEEFGDALWYLSALCRRVGLSLAELMAGAAEQGGYSNTIAASDLPDGPLVHIAAPAELGTLDNALMKLGLAAGALLERCFYW